MKKLFYLLAVMVIGTVLVSCKSSSKERKIVKVDYPDLGYLFLYEDNETVAEPINAFLTIKDFTFFNLKPSLTRKGWDQSRVGVWDKNQKVLIPPFYTEMVIVWDPAAQEYFFHASWKGTLTRHVYNMYGDKIAKIGIEKTEQLKKQNTKPAPATYHPITEWEIKNFRSKL